MSIPDTTFLAGEALAVEDVLTHDEDSNEPVYARFWNETCARGMAQDCFSIMLDNTDDAPGTPDTICEVCLWQIEFVMQNGNQERPFSVTFRHTTELEKSAELGCCICKLVRKCDLPEENEFLVCLLPRDSSENSFEGFELAFPDEFRSDESEVYIRVTRSLHFQLSVARHWSFSAAFARFQSLQEDVRTKPAERSLPVGPELITSSEQSNIINTTPPVSEGAAPQIDDEEYPRLLRTKEPDCGGIVSGYSGSKWCLDFLKECFDHCSNYHKICMETATSILPSRVIDVGLDGQEPFLFETNRANGSYFTLSYCWGGMIPQRTTSLNVDQYKKIIPLDILPSTFRDAIVLTRRFGVRYLWIDALCIIQDSINDWEVESAQMATIYGQCRAMIAASRSTSSTSGIFHRRPKKHGFPLPSQVFKYFKPPELSVHAVFADLDLAEEQEASPLAKRAWTLQEAILPRAVMHFLDGSTVWKCLKMRVSESGQYETLALKLTNGVPALCQNGAGSYILDADPGYGWLALVQEYTRRTLTFESDKLKAISGIANAYGRHGSNLYINGIWLDDLSRGIMWQAQSKSPRFIGRSTTINRKYQRDGARDTIWDMDRFARVTTGQAGVRLNSDDELEGEKPTQRTIISVNLSPSWSWASVDGPVVWKHGYKTGGVSLLRNIRLDPAPTESCYSKVDCAIIFEAQVQHIRFDSETGNFTACRDDGLLEDIKGVALEALPDIQMPCFIIWARALEDEEAYRTDFGCILVQSSNCSSQGSVECKRIGVSWMQSSIAIPMFKKSTRREIKLL